MATRLQHVSIPRPPGSDGAARHFYGDLLGLAELPSPKSLANIAVIWYALGNETELHLFEEDPAGQDRSGRHFCLAVDDLEEQRQRLEAAGVVVVSDVRIAGRPRYFCRDPFANLIELTTIDADYRLFA